jgi:alkyl sulfatase BDS1-like metallo-beta-lactamase superfamily hydrolase
MENTSKSLVKKSHLFYLEIVRGEANKVNVKIETSADTLTALVYGGRNLNEAIRLGDVRLEGDKKTLERFLKLFPLPD